MEKTHGKSDAYGSIGMMHDALSFLAIWGVAAFLGATIGPLICGPALYLIGEQSSPSLGYSRAGYAAVLAIGSFFVLLAAVLVRAVKVP